MDTVNAELSKRLHGILDFIGASEYTRKKCWELAMLNEIPITFLSPHANEPKNEYSLYQVGSTCEGTTTPGTSSDVDLLVCSEYYYAVDNLIESKEHELSYLMFTDEYTKPGYVCLQKVVDNCLMVDGMLDLTEEGILKVDQKGRICIIHTELPFHIQTTHNGPATTLPFSNKLIPVDIVLAFRCRHIPRSANSWLHRTRTYDWPSQIQLQAMGSLCCFLVGVGHPQSAHKSFEWRISFSLQERDLMSSLNETQHKCYILLKMIKKDIIEPRAGASISSYHCKTSLFYTIENSQRHFWTDDKLILCLHQCLKRLFIWVKANNCPNYFIPEENMFDKLSPITMKNVEEVLNDIIDNGVNYLFTLTCDNVGELLKSKVYGSELKRSIGCTCPINTYAINVCSSVAVYQVRNQFLRVIDVLSKTFTCHVIATIHFLFYLQSTTTLTEHHSRDVRQALDSIIPHIQLQYEQCKFAQCLSQENEVFLIPEIIHSSYCDLISSKLALASLYVQYEVLEEKCECILVSCQNSLEPYVISECGCNNRVRYNNTFLVEKVRQSGMSSKYFRRQCTTGCMAFLPDQVNLVHKALQYEMFRNAFILFGCESEMLENYWLFWITVDSRIYLHFIQYLLYSKTKKTTKQETAVQTLTQLLKTDLNLGHKETALNLCGWIRLQENDTPGAWRLFCLSWKARPFRNAAKWHMIILLGEVITGGVSARISHAKPIRLTRITWPWIMMTKLEMCIIQREFGQNQVLI